MRSAITSAGAWSSSTCSATPRTVSRSWPIRYNSELNFLSPCESEGPERPPKRILFGGLRPDLICGGLVRVPSGPVSADEIEMYGGADSFGAFDRGEAAESTHQFPGSGDRRSRGRLRI